MRLRNILLVLLASGLTLIAPACASHSYYLIRTGIIASRSADGHSPTMFVGDSGVSRLQACGHGAIVSFGRETKVVYENGSRADTSALTIGRKVSAFIKDEGIILLSCPPQAYAAKIVVH